MKPTALVVLGFVALGVPITSASDPITTRSEGLPDTMDESRRSAEPSLDALSFLIGDWDTEWVLFPGGTVPESGGSSGSTQVSWGPRRAWLTLRATADLPSSGPYEVVVLVVGRGADEGFDAFVVNTFGSGASYQGRILEDGALQFVGRVGSKTQRVTYTRVEDGRISFFVEESRDGESYEPHSRAVWHPEAADEGESTGATVQVRRQPPLRLLSRSVVGPYSLHEEVLSELLAKAEELGVGGSTVIAVYLSDPATTPPDQLRWELATLVGDAPIPPLDGPYSVRDVPEQDVAALPASLTELATASQRIDAWIDSAGLHQVGPTRVVWESTPGGDPRTGLVELVKPVAPSRPGGEP